MRSRVDSSYVYEFVVRRLAQLVTSCQPEACCCATGSVQNSASSSLPAHSKLLGLSDCVCVVSVWFERLMCADKSDDDIDVVDSLVMLASTRLYCIDILSSPRR